MTQVEYQEMSSQELILIIERMEEAHEKVEHKLAEAQDQLDELIDQLRMAEAKADQAPEIKPFLDDVKEYYVYRQHPHPDERRHKVIERCFKHTVEDFLRNHYGVHLR